MQITVMLCNFTGRNEVPIINSPYPVFSWACVGSGPSAKQSAYRIKVWEQSETALCWDSGKTVGSVNCVKYGGSSLLPARAYLWQISVWDGDDIPSAPSSRKKFITASFDQDDNLLSAQATVKFEYNYPALVRKLEHDIFFIDFGQHAFSRLLLALPVIRPKTLAIRLGEALNRNGRILKPEPKSQECNRRFRELQVVLYPDEPVKTIQLPVPEEGDDYQQSGFNCTDKMALNCPPHTGELMPFRYCEISGWPDDLPSGSVLQAAASYPFCEEAASFSSNCEVLNKVYDFCRYTVKATSAFAFYIDGDRERLPYAGDAFQAQLGHYRCDCEYSLMRNTLTYFLTEGIDWPFEALSYIILSFREDLMYTGDMEFCRMHYETLKRFLLPGLVRDDGLLVTGEEKIRGSLIKDIPLRWGFLRNLTDWPPAVRDNFEDGEINTVVNSLYYRALNAMADIAGSLGKNYEHKDFLSMASVVRNSVRDKLYDPKRHLFIDSEGSNHCSLHANMHALSSGIALPEDHPQAVEFLMRKGMSCGVGGSYFLLDALCKSGMTDKALELMIADDEHSWLGMLRQGATITTECWNNELKPNQDWNHVWGCVPVYIITRYFMGIEPLSPGFSRILIAPDTGSLKQAFCRCPSVRGDICVGINEYDGGFEMQCEIPANSEASIRLPEVGPGSVTHISNGNSRQFKLNENTRLIEKVPPGLHNFKIRRLKTGSNNINQPTNGGSKHEKKHRH